jgi:DNA-binding MarR family transcriptional regulator
MMAAKRGPMPMLAQPDPLAALAQQIEEQLARIRTRVRKPLASAVAAGRLTAAQQAAMRALVKSPEGLSLKALSQQMGLAHSTVSGIVDRLAARGMVERTRVAGDARFTSITPTQAVRDFLKTELPALTLGPLLHALERATPAQREAIRRGVNLLHELLQAPSAKDSPIVKDSPRQNAAERHTSPSAQVKNPVPRVAASLKSARRATSATALGRR